MNDQASRKRSHKQRGPQGAAGPSIDGQPPTLSASSGEREPHKCGVPDNFGTPHLCGSEEFCRPPLGRKPSSKRILRMLDNYMLDTESIMHSSVLSIIIYYKSQNLNPLCPSFHSPTILGTKTAPFFAVLSSGSVDYQRLTTIWEPPPFF